jgi:hypothetical protein
MRKLKSYPLAGILKVTSAAGRGKPPVPSRQAVNEKLTSRQGGQENSRIGSISDDSGRESDVRITPTTRYRDSGNSSLGRNRYRSVQSPTSAITNQCNHQRQKSGVATSYTVKKAQCNFQLENHVTFHVIGIKIVYNVKIIYISADV